MHKRWVHICPLFVTHSQLAKLIQPSESPLHRHRPSSLDDLKFPGSQAVIPQLALRPDEHRIRSGKPATDPIFKNSIGGTLDLNSCYQREMRN
jgi:hypothetical protein